MVNQTVGLAQALGMPFEQKAVPEPATLWRLVPSHWTANMRPLERLWPEGTEPPWPDVLISCGVRSVPAALALKRASGGRLFTVHVQSPQVPSHYFDMVVPPEHDRLTGTNVFPTMGALHHITGKTLSEGAERFRERFAALPRPLVAVLIGGMSKAYDLSAERMRELAGQLRALTADPGAGLIVTTSRRTGPECTAILHEALAGTSAMLWDGEGENPYPGMLALADWIIVTEDSASMMSEACFTGKPVYVAELGSRSKRFNRMHRAFRDAGFTRAFTGKLESWTYTPPDEAKRIAAIALERLRNRPARS